MRISDWSSDVCSSDLDHRQVVVVLAGHPQAERALHAVGTLELLVLAQLAGVERLRLDGAAQRTPALELGVVVGVALGPVELHPLDRKSVVSGKSVSVRVNLGGRHIFQNKTTNT